MSINRPGSPGTIAGFTKIDVGEDGTSDAEALAPGNWSAAQLTQWIMSLRKDLDPENIRKLTKIINSHVQNKANPHNVTLDAIISDIVKELLEPFAAGTIPTKDPSYSYHPALANHFFMECTRDTPTTIIDISGRLVTVPEDTVAVDYSNGHARISAWGEYFNHVNNDVSLQEAMGTSVTAVVNGSIDGISSAYKYTTSIDYPIHGLKCTMPILDTITPSIFIIPLTLSGYITLGYMDAANTTIDPEYAYTFSIEDNAVVTRAENIIPHVNILPNGCLRLGITGEDITSNLAIIYHPVLDTYTHDTSGMDIFLAFGLMCNAGAEMAPFIYNDTDTPVRLGSTKLTLPIKDMTSVGGMINLEVDIHGRDGNIMELSDIKYNLHEGDILIDITPEDTMPLHIPFTPTTLKPTLNIAVSYTINMIKAKITDEPTITLVNEYGAITPDTEVTFGPFPGYIGTFTLYPTYDDNRSLNFMVGDEK